MNLDYIVKTFFLIVSIFCCYPKFNADLGSATKVKPLKQAVQKIDCSNDVFSSYYDLVLDSIEKDACFTFEEFKKHYYVSNLTIYDFCEYIITNNYFPSQQESEYFSSATSLRSSEVADYIFYSNDSNSITPSSCFRRTPQYHFFDANDFENGDVIFESLTVLNNIGHSATIYNNNHNSDYGYYIQTIEAVNDAGVMYGFLDDERIVRYGVYILRHANITTSNVSSICYFLNYQLGKPYLFWPSRLNTSINSSYWYCSELVYAAYSYAGINLNCINDDGGVLPWDLYYSNQLSAQIVLSYRPYVPDVYIYGLVNNKWSFNLANFYHSYRPGSSTFTIQYNSKMCFENDAKNWTNLSDVSSVYVYPNAYGSVTISKNWFATHVTFRWVYNNCSFICYANNLNSNGTMTKYYNFKYDV